MQRNAFTLMCSIRESLVFPITLWGSRGPLAVAHTRISLYLSFSLSSCGCFVCAEGTGSQIYNISRALVRLTTQTTHHNTACFFTIAFAVFFINALLATMLGTKPDRKLTECGAIYQMGCWAGGPAATSPWHQKNTCSTTIHLVLTISSTYFCEQWPKTRGRK